MSLNLGELFATLRLDSSGFKKGAADAKAAGELVKAQLDSLGNSAVNLASKLGRGGFTLLEMASAQDKAGTSSARLRDAAVGFDRSISKLTASAEVLGGTFGSALLPAATSVAGAFSDVLDKAATLDPALVRLMGLVGAGGVGAVGLGGGFLVAAGAADKFGKALSALPGLAAGLWAVAAPFLAIGAAVVGAGAGLGALSEAMRDAQGRSGAMRLGGWIADKATAAYRAVSGNESVGQGVDWTKQTAKGFGENLKDALAYALKGWDLDLQTLSDKWSSLFDGPTGRRPAPEDKKGVGGKEKDTSMSFSTAESVLGLGANFIEFSQEEVDKAFAPIEFTVEEVDRALNATARILEENNARMRQAVGTTFDTLGALFQGVKSGDLLGILGDQGIGKATLYLGKELESLGGAASMVGGALQGLNVASIASFLQGILAGVKEGISTFLDATVGLAAKAFTDERLGKVGGAAGAILGPGLLAAGGVALGGVSSGPLAGVTVLGTAAAGVAAGLFALSLETESFKKWTQALSLSFDHLVKAVEPFWERLLPLAGVVYLSAQAFSLLVGKLLPGELIFRGVFDAAKGLGLVLMDVEKAALVLEKGFYYFADGAIKLFNTIAGSLGLNKIETENGFFLGNWSRIDSEVEALDKQRKALGEMTYEGMGAFVNSLLEATDTVAALNDELTNTPEGFKIQRYRYGAQDASGLPRRDVAEGGFVNHGVANQNHVTINVQASDPHKFSVALLEMLERLGYENGTLPAGRTKWEGR